MAMEHHHRPGLWPGLILASVGGGLLAREFGLLPPQVRFVDFWPLLVVFVGVSALVRARGFVGILFSLAFVAFGGLLLAGNLGFLAVPTARLWPGLLILLGLAFLMRGGPRPGHHPRPPYPRPDAEPGAYDDLPEADREPRLTTEGDFLVRRVAFSGLELKVESQAWRGGELSVTAGGVEIDLRYARLDPAGAILDLRVVMGGIDLRVPDTWQIQNDVTPLLGGADDSTRSTQGSIDAPLLRIVGTVTMGGISIHN